MTDKMSAEEWVRQARHGAMGDSLDVLIDDFAQGCEEVHGVFNHEYYVTIHEARGIAEVHAAAAVKEAQAEIERLRLYADLGRALYASTPIVFRRGDDLEIQSATIDASLWHAIGEARAHTQEVEP